MIFQIIIERAGLFQPLVILLNCLLLSASSSLSSSSSLTNEHDKNDSSTALPTIICLFKSCPENQFCNQNFVCTNQQGIKIIQGPCTKCAGEHDNCTKATECCSFLYCNNGVCRKPGSALEFITLTKISLGITIVIVIIAILIFLLRSLINFRCQRYQQFQRQDDTISTNSAYTYVRQIINQSSPPYDIRRDKPPSYEECIGSFPRSILLDSPPPYVISSILPPEVIRTERTKTYGTPQNSNATQLSVQALGMSFN